MSHEYHKTIIVSEYPFTLVQIRHLPTFKRAKKMETHELQTNLSCNVASLDIKCIKMWQSPVVDPGACKVRLRCHASPTCKWPWVWLVWFVEFRQLMSTGLWILWHPARCLVVAQDVTDVAPGAPNTFSSNAGLRGIGTIHLSHTRITEHNRTKHVNQFHTFTNFQQLKLNGSHMFGNDGSLILPVSL